MKSLKLLLILISLAAASASAERPKVHDVVIYGGTSAGISAAVQTSRMGKSVLIINPGRHIGGLTTGGLGKTDSGNSRVVGGISREFYQRIKKYYDRQDAWKWEKPRVAEADAMWTFEPHAAMSVFQGLIKEHHIQIICNERLDLKKGVEKREGKITAIQTESGKRYIGKMFIDATYEGDLMALAGVSYTIGREGFAQYGESLNGVQLERSRKYTHYSYNQFGLDVDPYLVIGDPAGGLLPGINKDPGVEGAGDKKVQAYCFRMCLTDVPENRVSIEKPKGYDELEYELLLRYMEKGYRDSFFIMSMMPNRKTDTNNDGGFSSDFIGRNYDYPNGNYEQREKLVNDHKTYQLGLLWTLANHPRVPPDVSEEWRKWGLAKDEFTDNGHWPTQLYVREARRMVSDLVMTQHHITSATTVKRSIGMGSYGMDSHNVQRYVTKEGFVKNEGDVQVHGHKPYMIDYQSIIPRRAECANLFVPVCLSTSHIAYGSVRMEPVFMILGQSAATAACLAIDKNVPVQDVDYSELRERLLADKQILSQ